MAGWNREGWWATTASRTSRQAKYGRPPPSPGSLQPSVPLWERKFCTSSCRISWKKLCEAKSFVHLYPNIIKWDDSAGEEAFQIAKARFYAEINGRPYDIPLPGPDIYIDVVDYDAVIDPELVEDLYKQPPAPDNGERDLSSEWDSFIFANKPVPATGWGDAEDLAPNIIRLDPQSVIIQPTGWGDAEDSVPTNDTTAEPPSLILDNNVDFGKSLNSDIYANSGNLQNDNNGWGDGVAQCNLWESGGRDHSWAYGMEKPWGHQEIRKNEQTRRHSKKRDGEAPFGFKSSNSRNQVEDSARNCRGRRWNSINACGTMNHCGSSSDDAWQWQKSLS